MRDPLDILKRVFGYERFFPLQEKVVAHILAGHDALVIMPTGGGKSLCFQIPALCLEGLTLVISPLVSLMRDQTTALQANGVAAACLNSAQTQEEADDVLRALSGGRLKLLYISPERLFSGSTAARLPSWDVSLVAVDEAHCISFWGHDFRPEYTRLGALREMLPGVPLVALTATADPAIQRDILSQLSIDEDSVFLASFDRPNLHLAVLPGRKRFEGLLEFIGNRRGQAGIVYCLSRAATEDLAEKLRQRGFAALAYHAGMDSADRHAAQDSFLRDETTIVCATVAFGMGIDKSNVRWVVHWNLPKNIEGFYQEIGRAGRDGLPADTLLFYSYADVAQQLKFIDEASPDRRELLTAKLDRMKRYAEARSCRRRILLSYFGETLDTDCGHCDVCEDPPDTFDGTIIAQKLLSAVLRTRERATLRQCALLLRGSRAQDVVEPGWHTLKTFGAGREHRFEEWMEYGAQLVNGGYVSVAYDRGQVLQTTSLSGPVLRGEKAVPLVRFGGFEKKKAPAVQPKTVDADRGDPGLFEHLKAVRRKLAEEHEVPAYVIFSDKTLKEIAAKAPGNPAEFRQIHGVGEVKADGYGPAFLQAIREWSDRG